MKTGILVLLIFIVSSLNITAQTLQLNEGNIRFISDKKGITSENNTFKSEINIQEKNISFSVSITGVTFQKKKMQDHFYGKGVMHSESFPEATFIAFSIFLLRFFIF